MKKKIMGTGLSPKSHYEQPQTTVVEIATEGMLTISNSINAVNEYVWDDDEEE